jgi:hypothetical protein
MSIDKLYRKSYRTITLSCRNNKPLGQLITALNEYIKLFPNSSEATRYLHQRLQEENNETREIMVSRIKEALEPNQYYAIQINQNTYDVSIPKVNPIFMLKSS